MAHVRDSDTALWLHNKLGSAEELWIPSSISGIIKTTTIDNIYRCFPVLTTTVKLKLLLGVLHLPRRNLEEMKHTIEGIIELAMDDSDIWVKLVANIIKSYPMTFHLNLDLRSSPIAQHVLQQAADKVKAADTFSNLPLECQFVNKSALQTLVGTMPPLKRHFALLKRPKSAALRTELLLKSEEAVSQLKKGGTGIGSKTVPVKHRDMTRRSSDMGPMKRIPTKATMSKPDLGRSISSNTPTANRNLSRISGRQQPGGTKLLDISEQPIGGSGLGVRDSKRRKKMLQQQDATNASQLPDEETEREKPPEYAVGLLSSTTYPEQTSEVLDQDETSQDESQASSQRATSDIGEDSSSEVEGDMDVAVSDRQDEVSKADEQDVKHLSKEQVLQPQPAPALVSTISQPAIPAKILSSPNNVTFSTEEPKIIYAVTSSLQSPARQIGQENKTIYRLTSTPQISSPEKVVLPFQQIHLVQRASSFVRQTAPTPVSQPTIITSMQSPVVVQKFAPHTNFQATTTTSQVSVALQNQQRHIQTSLPMYVPNRLVFSSQAGHRATLPQSTSQPTQILIRQTIPQPSQQQQQKQQQQQQQQLHNQRLQQQLHRHQALQSQLNQQRHLQPISQVSTVSSQPRIIQQPIPLSNPNIFQQPQVQQTQRLATPRLQPQQQLAYIKPQVASNPAPKHGLMLTREQMFEAQELFRIAPNLTRPEKAIILGFMAGNRENPYPDQGDVIRFILNESLQHMQNSHGGGIFQVVVENVLELNYGTGKWNKVSRLKNAQPLTQTVLKT